MSTPPGTPSDRPPHPRSLVQLLRDGRGPLIARWCQRVLDDPSVPVANRLPVPVLQDHIPGLIDRIAECLEQHANIDHRGEQVGRHVGHAREARGHAHDRFAHGYTLPAALRELSHFRAAIVDLCRAEGLFVSADEAMLIHTAIDEAVALVANEIHGSAQAALRSREAAHARAVEVLEHGDGCLVLDRDFRIVLVNQQQERLSQTRREDTLGRLLWEVFPAIAGPHSRYWVEYQRVMRDRVPVTFAEYYAPLGLWTDVTAYPTADGGIAVFFRDATQEKRAVEELRRDADLRERFLGILSHDLKQPLGAVLFSADTLLRQVELPPQGLRSVQRIAQSARRMDRLISDLLDLVRGRQGGGIPIAPRALDLRALCEQVIEEIFAVYPDRSIELAARGDGQGVWDPERLAQLVSNLVTNAIAYSPAGTRVAVEVDGEDPHSVTLRVHNEGEPIPPDLLPVLFDPFRRGASRAEYARVSPGLGLGLHIAHAIVSAHGGVISVESSAADGTTFTVRLPRESRESRESQR